MERAYFAGGCFWGMEAVFQQKVGVINTIVGYMGGTKDNPTYEEVSSGTTGHVETVYVEYDESVIRYLDLLETFFSNHNPTEYNRQGSDEGEQYRSVIFYTTPEQKEIALKYIKDLEAKGEYIDPVVTDVIKAENFWPANDCHQSYYLKMRRRYVQGIW
jgi:peptide-methionine (S)-S-oxide reductase